MRYGDGEGGKAIVLKGQPTCPKQLGRPAKPSCDSGRYVVELQFNLLNRDESFINPRCQHQTPRSHQAASDLR
jgi:hypothetical protein